MGSGEEWKNWNYAVRNINQFLEQASTKAAFAANHRFVVRCWVICFSFGVGEETLRRAARAFRLSFRIKVLTPNYSIERKFSPLHPIFFGLPVTAINSFIPSLLCWMENRSRENEPRVNVELGSETIFSHSRRPAVWFNWKLFSRCWLWKLSCWHLNVSSCWNRCCSLQIIKINSRISRAFALLSWLRCEPSKQSRSRTLE